MARARPGRADRAGAGATEPPCGFPNPGEEYRYLTEFAGSAIYADDLPPLNRAAIHRDIPLRSSS